VTERKKLSDILQQNSDREKLRSLFKSTTAAAEFAPLPKGEYTFRILAGELFTSKGLTPGFKLTLEVTEGDLAGRRAWYDLWLTKAALPMAKRDLAKIGVSDLEQLEQPLPPGILIKGKLAVRKDDNGNESNRLISFECVGIEKPDPFAPSDADAGEPAAARAAPSTNGQARRPEGATP
jgi:hypothetical protein